MTEKKDQLAETPRADEKPAAVEKPAPVEEQGPVQRYRFRVRTADGRELISHIATVKLPPGPVPQPLQMEPLAMVATPLLEMQPLAPAPVAKNYDFTRVLVNVQGSKQGKFRADTAKGLDSHQFAGVELELALRASIDAATGQRSGRHRHEQVVLTKELGPSTPQFWGALASNETLTSVVLDCYGMEIKGMGKEELYFTIKLTDASVASAELQKLNNKHADLMKIPDCERIAFTYEKIEWSWKNGASASDDWQERS